MVVPTAEFPSPATPILLDQTIPLLERIRNTFFRPEYASQSEGGGLFLARAGELHAIDVDDVVEQLVHKVFPIYRAVEIQI